MRKSDWQSDLHILHELVKSSLKSVTKLLNSVPMTDSREYYHRHLPHWQPQGATFFVTFRLKGSLPNDVIKSMHENRERERLARERLPADTHEKQAILDEHHSFGKWDSLLDKAESGPCWLSQVNIANIVKETLHYHDSRDYDLHAYCIMSNHVHVVFTPLVRKSDLQSSLDFKPLYKIMQSLKLHTARKANIVIGRGGTFWQDESYDQVVRNNNEFLQIVHYVLKNPVKAGLVSKWEDWPWSYQK